MDRYFPLKNSAGFALPSILFLLSFISILIGLSYQHLQTEFKKSSSFTIHQKIFAATEKQLNECEAMIQPPYKKIQTNSCCVIESIQDKKSHHYFRVSTHMLGINLHDPTEILSQSRQQSFLIETIDQNKKIILNYRKLAWREILDMDWENKLMQDQTNPWQIIKPCITPIQKMI